jgi:hypothetical protein
MNDVAIYKATLDKIRSLLGLKEYGENVVDAITTLLERAEQAECAARLAQGAAEVWKAKAEALEADSRRYRWLMARATKKTAYDRYGNGAHWSIGFFAEDSLLDFDAAIAAQQEKQG